MENNIFTDILSWLLHHANRKPSHEFYRIKNLILSKYGKHICYDVQFIEGKKCWSCDGTGKFISSYKPKETCWSCSGTGWYKKPVWNILSLVQFGKYEFHRPMNRVYKKPKIANKMIEGYINHTPTYYSDFALTVLFLIYEKGYLKKCFESFKRKVYFKKELIRIKFSRTFKSTSKFKDLSDESLPF